MLFQTFLYSAEHKRWYSDDIFKQNMIKIITIKKPFNMSLPNFLVE